MILYFIVLLLIIYLYYKNIYSFDKKLECFSCPPELPILGHALDFMTENGPLHVFIKYIEKYGDTVRIKIGPAQQLLLTADYEFFELLSLDTKIMKKASDYKYFYKWLGQGLITSNGATWKTHRRIISPTFNNNFLASFIDVFESNAKILLKQFDKHLGNQSVNIYKLINLCTLDIICETAMGMSISAQENCESEYVQSVKSILDIIIRRILSPHKMFDCIYYFTEDYKREEKVLEIIHSYPLNIIKHRERIFHSENTSNSKSFLEYLFAKSMTLKEIREEVDTFMFAGHDTTASTISFVLFSLANHPLEQENVFEEQKSIFGDNFTRDSTYEDLRNMKYLDMVIKECLRLYPPGPFFSRELTEDVQYKNTVLPKGLSVSFFLYGLHRNPKYFTEPEKFVPERFQGKNPLGFLPFGLGPRTCIGQKFAMLEMATVISRVLRSFVLLPSTPRHELKIEAQIILISSNGVCIGLKKRSDVD